MLSTLTCASASARLLRSVVPLVAGALCAGCSILPGDDDLPPAAVFMLQPSGADEVLPAEQIDCPVLQVRPARAAAGFLTDRMLYTRHANQVEYFSQSRWVDVPARMIDGHVLERLANAGVATVITAAAPVSSRYRLDLSDVRLLQHFDGEKSAVTLDLHAALFDTGTRRQLDGRRLAARQTAGSDARSGVAAANAALARLLDELAHFVSGSLRAAAPECD